ncbi:MAG: 50S ribosomal protein L6 [Lentisphaerae bacterium]|nr:50S ribosomal protein L6 [Lentisphaerota bacterium]
MSRIGIKPVAIPKGVEVKVDGGRLSVKGPKGSLSMAVNPLVEVQLEGSLVKVARKQETEQTGAVHGMVRSLIVNMVKGVSEGYTRALEIQGVGFKSAVQGRKVTFSLGFANPLDLAIPEGVDVKVAENVNITVAGVDKQVVGDFAARIRSLYPAEPYKGKGIRFKGEHVRRKVGKTVA